MFLIFWSLFIFTNRLLLTVFVFSFLKETERQKVQLESENRALRVKVCDYFLTCRLPPTFSTEF